MTVAAKWLLRLEIALLISGISFFGGAFAATAWRWDYQARQERALGLSEFQETASDDLAIPPPPNVSLPARIGRKPSADPRVLARIEIPRVGVKAIVREGVDSATLAVAVGHIGGTARPGETGNIVLAGHRDTFFRGLRNIRMNDRVRLNVPPHSYEYRVVSFEIVTPDETSVLEPTRGQELTLVTCYPFGYIGRAPNRFIVRASRVE